MLQKLQRPPPIRDPSPTFHNKSTTPRTSGTTCVHMGDIPWSFISHTRRHPVHAPDYSDISFETGWGTEYPYDVHAESRCYRNGP